MTSSAPTSITIPTQAQVDDALAKFQTEWGLVDEVLYRVCRDHPGHDSARVAVGKVALIGRAYAAGLERQVNVMEGEQAVVKAGLLLHAESKRVDAIIKPLRNLPEPLDPAKAGLIVEQHGLLTELLQRTTRSGQSGPRSARSFASKYLHFHCPAVPIYDEYVRSTIARMAPWDSQHLPSAKPPRGDEAYWRYVVSFQRLYEAATQAGVYLSVKSLDAWLWSLEASGVCSDEG
jgi:hypothetical protein